MPYDGRRRNHGGRFPVNAANNIATTTFAVPSAVTRILITGLQRSKGYDVTIGTPATARQSRSRPARR